MRLDWQIVPEERVKHVQACPSPYPRQCINEVARPTTAFARPSTAWGCFLRVRYPCNACGHAPPCRHAPLLIPVNVLIDCFQVTNLTAQLRQSCDRVCNFCFGMPLPSQTRQLSGPHHRCRAGDVFRRENGSSQCQIMALTGVFVARSLDSSPDTLPPHATRIWL